MIRPVNRRNRRYFDYEIQEILDFWNYDVKDNSDPELDDRVFTVMFSQACGTQRYFIHDGDSPMGDLEYCTVCEEVFVSIAGSIYDEDECANCGDPRD